MTPIPHRRRSAALPHTPLLQPRPPATTPRQCITAPLTPAHRISRLPGAWLCVTWAHKTLTLTRRRGSAAPGRGAGRANGARIRRLFAPLVVAGLLAGLTACSDAPNPHPVGATQQRPAARASSSAKAPSQPLATLHGPRRLKLVISSALRDAGGFVTVRGTLTNTGTKTQVVPAHLSGDEPDIIKHGPSLGGATLIDFAGGKRYYVLRDTEGRPLTTTALTIVKAGERLPVFMQFPAPPTRTRQVTLQLPQFDTAPLPLSR